MVSETKTTEAPGLRRELKARHLTMIAIGGSIGTGLFVASGATISQAGPGGALLSYMLIGLMVYFLMTSLGELAAYMPVSGSFATYGQNYVEEGFGFALGWNYWYNWAVTIAVDLVAAQLVMSWWFPDTPGWIWSALFLGVIFLLNYISVRGFGEAEYWFSLIKVTTVIVFIIVGVLMIIGYLQRRAACGLEQLDNRRSAVCWWFCGDDRRSYDCRLLFPGNRADRYCCRRVRRSGEKHSTRGTSGVLANPVVLCVRDPDYQPDYSVHRSEPAA
ncbi:hypothetical protein VEE15_00250 [Escherichia coli]|nr:hypothetical protein VEE15_00250 [Escherichia coli]